MKQVEVEYNRYASLCEFTGKPVPMFEDYVTSKGLNVEDYLTPEELSDCKRRRNML
jgi:hypothetical protein